MKDFIEKIVSSIIECEFNIKEEEEQEGLLVFTILVPESEIGKIIGKEGKVVNSIRSLCRVKANQTQKKVLIKVEKLVV